MARRKKRHHSRRRRRVSGFGSLDLQGIGLAIAGAVIAKKLTDTLLVSTNETAQKAAPYVALGTAVIVPMFIKSPMIRALSIGLAAGGGVEALKGLKVITGFDTVSSIMYGNGQYKRFPVRKSGVGYLPSKSNWSGSRLSQMHTIGHTGMGIAAENAAMNPNGSGDATLR